MENENFYVLPVAAKLLLIPTPQAQHNAKRLRQIIVSIIAVFNMSTHILFIQNNLHEGISCGMTSSVAHSIALGINSILLSSSFCYFNIKGQAQLHRCISNFRFNNTYMNMVLTNFERGYKACLVFILFYTILGVILITKRAWSIEDNVYDIVLLGLFGISDIFQMNWSIFSMAINCILICMASEQLVMIQDMKIGMQTRFYGNIFESYKLLATVFGLTTLEIIFVNFSSLLLGIWVKLIAHVTCYFQAYYILMPCSLIALFLILRIAERATKNVS